MRFKILLVLLFIATCSSDAGLITNKQGNYSIQVLDGWNFAFNKEKTVIQKTKSYGSKYVTGTLTVSEGPTEFETLDETVATYLSQFPRTFIDFKKISEGKTGINGMPSRWYRMTDNQDGTNYMTVQYVLQKEPNVCYVLNCSATSDTFKDFEEDFTKMVFTYKRLR